MKVEKRDELQNCIAVGGKQVIVLVDFFELGREDAHALAEFSLRIDLAVLILHLINRLLRFLGFFFSSELVFPLIT